MTDDFVEVARADDLAERAAVGVIAHGYQVALFRMGDEFYALEALCPHAGGPLEEGYVKATTVTCPRHASRFRLDTGECVAGPAPRGAAVFPVKVTGGAVFVGPPPPGLDPPPPLPPLLFT